MDPKKGSNYMEKAIEKASRLIDLLTKQNGQLKQQNLNLQTQLDAYRETEAQIQSHTQQNIEKVKKLQSIIEQKDQKISNLTSQLGLLEQKIGQRTRKNKELHQKLGDFAGKNQQLQKLLEKEKKKSLSLKNQNDYLLKTFAAHQAKENQFQNIYNMAQEQFKKQITLVDRTKQAFSRKCQQLQIENSNMRRQILGLNEKINEVISKQNLYLYTQQKISELQKEIKRTNDALSYIIQSTLRIKAETGLYLKVQQIKNYISYRLQHIENLVKPISEIFAVTSPNLKQIKDLQTLNSLINRLSSYLSQLIK